jgi:heme exporter protein C
MSMFIYLVMAFWAAVGLAFNTRLSFMMASALAPTGALFAFLSLWTGALWGKPMWGAWWVWDARLTSELILLFLYYRLHRPAGGDRRSAPRRQGRRDPGAGRRGQRADHLFLGQVVEHPAPGRLGEPDQGAQHGDHDALGHAADARWPAGCTASRSPDAGAPIMLERERHTDWVRELLAGKLSQTAGGRA